MDTANANGMTPDGWKPFPVDCLPKCLAKYTKTAATAIGCDESFIALPLLAGAAAAIGNSRQLRIKKSWTEPAVLWGALVAESGELKSPAIDAALRSVKVKQADEIERFRKEYEAYQAAKEQYEDDRREWRRTKPSERGAVPVEPVAPRCQRFYVDDITVEALVDRLADNPRGLLVAKDELSGWLQGFNQYKGGRGADVGHWLTMFNARGVLLDRKDKDRPTVHAPRAAVSVVGGIQPDILRDCLGVEYFSNGLAARLLLVVPPRKPKQFTEDDIDEQSAAEIADIFSQLYALEPGIDENGNPFPINVNLAPDGKRAWITFYNQHAKETAELTGHLAACWSKIEAYAARLALIHHLCRWADCEAGWTEDLDAQSVAAGVALARWFANEARRVYSALRETDEDREVRYLWELMGRKGGRLTAREVMRSSSVYQTAPAAETALGLLVKRQMAARVVVDTGGRQKIVWRSLHAIDIDTSEETNGESEVVSSPGGKNGELTPARVAR